MCLMDKILALDKLPLGMNYSANGCEFYRNKSMPPPIQKKEQDICPSVCEATTESAQVTSTMHDKAMGRWKRSSLCGFMR